MDEILAMLAAEQNDLLMLDIEVDLTIEFANRPSITGIIESVTDGVVSIRRLLREGSYAEISRHYSISAVTGAYYTEDS